MYNREFFSSQLGKASLASVAAMTAMIALTTQMSLVTPPTDLAQPHGSSTMLVEMA